MNHAHFGERPEHGVTSNCIESDNGIFPPCPALAFWLRLCGHFHYGNSLMVKEQHVPATSISSGFRSIKYTMILGPLGSCCQLCKHHPERVGIIMNDSSAIIKPRAGSWRRCSDQCASIIDNPYQHTHHWRSPAEPTADA